jgi:GntR family transcriptional regulator
LLFSKRALYLQVRDMLAERIARAEWKPGFQISNEGDLARELGVSSGTVRKALELMEAEHLISRRQGRGTFVRDPASVGLADRYVQICGPDGERLRDCTVKAEEIEQSLANDQERTRLRLSDADEVYRIRRIRRHNGQNVVVEDATLPVAMFPRLHERRDIDEIGVLALQYSLLLGRAHERISTAIPLQGVAGIIGLPPDLPTMVLDRTILTLDGRPAEWRVAYCRLGGVHYLAEVA